MTPLRLLTKTEGWAAAFFNVFVLWGINSVVLGYASKMLGAHGMVYTASMFLSAAFVLLMYAGPGPFSRETIRSLDTWAYGFSLIFGFLVLFELFSHVTAAEGALLQRFSIVATALAGAFFMSQRMAFYKLFGMALVSGGIVLIWYGVPASELVPVMGLVVLFAFIQATRVIIAQMHKSHTAAVKQSNTLKTRCRIVGYVMFVVALIFLFAGFLAAIIHHATGEFIFMGAPTLYEFTRAESLLAGLLAGILLAGPIRLLEFYSAQKIKAENFLAITCLGAFATLFWEWISSPLTGLSLKQFTTHDILAGVLIMLGGAVFAVGALRAEKGQGVYKRTLTYAPLNPDATSDSREIVESTMEHFADDISKTAKALEQPPEVIKAILQDKEHILAFQEHILKDVARCYRKKVAQSDPLTGLANRAAFMTALKAAEYEAEQYSIIYIDLDKFKPVNDTYGHDVGDAVLVEVAARLKAALPQGTMATRMGGDEYCVLLLEISKPAAEKLAAEVQAAIQEPFILPQAPEPIHVGASLGVANFPEDGLKARELLAIADRSMYGVKHAG